MNIHHTRTRNLLITALAVAVAGNLLAADPGPEKGKDQAKGAGPIIIPRFQPPGDAVAISPGTDIQALVDKHPAGTAFVLKAGTHRLQTIKPKDGMSFYGEVGPDGKLLSVLSGAQLVTTIKQEGDFWVIPVDTKQIRTCAEFQGKLKVEPGWEGSSSVIDVFVDNRMFRHVKAGKDKLKEVKDAFFIDFDAGKIFLAENLEQKTVEISKLAFAFNGMGGRWGQETVNTNNVTIRNMVIEKYACGDQENAIMAGSNWIVEGNEVRFNHGSGIGFHAAGDTRGVCRFNYVHHNGSRGISVNHANHVLIEQNESAFNNCLNFSRAWIAAGIKIQYGDNCVIRSNYIHDNYCKGVWIDVLANNTLVERNRIISNSSSGVTIEISLRNKVMGNELINNNLKESYDPSAVFIQSCAFNEIAGNTIVVSSEHGSGVVLAFGSRGAEMKAFNDTKDLPDRENCYCHENIVRNNITYFHNNAGVSGIFTGYEGWENNVFRDNSYFVLSGTSSERFVARKGRGKMTLEQFQAQGFETGSTIEMVSTTPYSDALIKRPASMTPEADNVNRVQSQKKGTQIGQEEALIRKQLIEKYDTDKNGELSLEEKKEMGAEDKRRWFLFGMTPEEKERAKAYLKSKGKGGDAETP